eukprot:10802138-Heterocapsa_arctica.AAC.1
METIRWKAAKSLALVLQKPRDMFTHVELTQQTMVATLALNTVNGKMRNLTCLSKRLTSINLLIQVSCEFACASFRLTASDTEHQLT